jgi:predicted DCC family thiol-disulfide oxidoreductase YuxK
VLYRKSDAALHLMTELRGGLRLLGAFRIVPRPLRDWVDDFVARNRYRWFGRRDSCMIPQGDLRGRFLEDGIG